MKNELGWAKIHSIEPAAEEDVYDIEIEGTHNFVGNGIVAHNTYLGTVSASGLATLGQASTTVFSSYGPAYFGATATSSFDSTGALTLVNALTYGGVTLSNAVTGTGNMVLSASPTFTGTIAAAAANFSGGLTSQQASTSLLSVFQNAYFGGTATSTFDSTGFLTLVNGFNSQASSTIGNGTQAGGLTISGGATTTGTALINTLTLTNDLTVANGGTGASTLTGLLQGNGTSAFTAISDSSTAGQLLRVTGSNTYAWGALDLADTDAITGDLPFSNLAQLAANSVLANPTGSTADAQSVSTSTLYGAAITAGQVLMSTGSGWTAAATATCVQITGSASLCDGSDAEGAGGGGFDFPNIQSWGNATSTTLGFLQGFLSTASSTINANLTITGNSTTTSATTTQFHISSIFNFAGDVFDELVGTGLQVINGDLQTTLGTAIDVSDETNLASSWPIVLTGDTLSFNG